MEKIIKYKDIEEKLDKFVGKKVLAGGCFDILHVGHIRYLKQAKAKGDILIIALESDKYIKKVKGRLPIHKQKYRAEILSALVYVDVVILLPRLKTYADYLSLVKLVRPNIIAITQGDPQIKNKQKQANIIRADVVEVTGLLNSSTRKILSKIKTT